MYSQNNEEKHITEYFKDNSKGKFLEIGGYNPFTFSNTRKLYELGWSGVYVEPSETCFNSFVKEYKDNKKITLLKYAITSYDGEIDFYDSKGDAISSISVEHCKKWKAMYDCNFDKITVPCMSMETLISQYGNNIDFLNLDVEGNNIQLFRLIPVSFFERLKMICIEHDNHNVEIESKLNLLGFKKILFNAENIIMAK